MKDQIIYLIDNDDEFCQSINQLLITEGMSVQLFSSAADFLKVIDSDLKGCVISDVIFSQGTSGLKLQAAMRKKRCVLPLIFVTSHADVNVAVEAIKKGAFDFLQKPVDHSVLLKTIVKALKYNHENASFVEGREDYKKAFDSLTRREREVLAFMYGGKTSKFIAKELDISHRTVEVHRHHILKKFSTKNVVTLTRFRDAI